MTVEQIAIALLSAFLAVSLIVHVITCMKYRGTRKQHDPEVKGDRRGTLSTEHSPHSHRVTISAEPIHVREGASNDKQAALEAEVQRLRRLLHSKTPPAPTPAKTPIPAAAQAQAPSSVKAEKNEEPVVPEAEVEALRAKLIQSRSKELALQEESEQAKVDVRLLEKENSRLKAQVATMRAESEREITRMLHDMKEIQHEVAGKGDAEKCARRLTEENAQLRSELEKEREESQLLFGEVERLKHIETKVGRLEHELSTRPVLRVPSPTRVVTVEREAKDTYSPPYPSAYQHIPRLTLMHSFQESARSPSPLLSPLAESRVRNLSSAYRSRSAGQTRTSRHTALTKTTMANIDAALGLSPKAHPMPTGRRPILTNPLDSWG